MSHFSTVKTELRQRQPLVAALRDLGYSPEEGARCLLYTSPSPRDRTRSRMPSSA